MWTTTRTGARTESISTMPKGDCKIASDRSELYGCRRHRSIRRDCGGAVVVPLHRSDRTGGARKRTPTKGIGSFAALLETRFDDIRQVQLKLHGGRIVSRIRHDFFKDCSEDAFLHCDRRVLLIPQPLQIIAKGDQIVLLLQRGPPLPGGTPSRRALIDLPLLLRARSWRTTSRKQRQPYGTTEPQEQAADKTIQ